MRTVGRRELFLRSAGAAAALAGAAGRTRAADRSRLVRDPKGVLDLPKGFSYRVVSRSGERMDDGYRVPGNPDAMGVFTTPGALVLMRNHEIMPGDRGQGPYPDGVSPPSQAYDPLGFGGVTRLVLDPSSLRVRHTNLALCGTHWNCAGGLSPWGWLSCEEIFAPGHGYVFLCPADAPRLAPARRLTGYGRFRHEAASVDPNTGVAYLTEDREDAAFYRFVPRAPDDPWHGRLQALRVVGRPAFDANALAAGRSLPVDWIDVSDPDPEQDNVRHQAHERGAAVFARTEGLWLDGPDVYFSATIGGPIGRGQIFRLADAAGHARLQLVVQTTDPAILDMPDNLTVSPTGQLYVAEDGPGGNYLRRVTPAGEVVDFARNAHSASEFAGPCFAPDGATLFVNIQHDGLTLAIRGPFAAERGGPAAPPRAPRPAGALGPTAAGLGAGAVALALGALALRKHARRTTEGGSGSGRGQR